MTIKPSGYIRAAMHAAVTLCLAAFLWFVPRPASLWAVAALAGLFFLFELVRLNLWRLNDFFFACARPVLRPGEWWRPTGAAYVLWGTMAAAFCFPKGIAVAALTFLAVGDAASSLVGSYFSTRRSGPARFYRSLGCFISCAVASLALHYAGLGVNLPVLLSGALSVAVVETLPLPVDDNLSLPLAAGLVMSLLSL